MITRKHIRFLLTIMLLELQHIYASLMMSPQELSALESIREKNTNKAMLNTTKGTSVLPVCTIDKVLFLSAILCLSPSHWTVWINDRTYTADNIEDDILIIRKVTSDYIIFDLKRAKINSTKLRINQSLILAEHNIIEGDAREKDSKPILL